MPVIIKKPLTILFFQSDILKSIPTLQKLKGVLMVLNREIYIGISSLVAFLNSKRKPKKLIKIITLLYIKVLINKNVIFQGLYVHSPAKIQFEPFIALFE